jgi:hypothetical protein
MTWHQGEQFHGRTNRADGNNTGLLGELGQGLRQGVGRRQKGFGEKEHCEEAGQKQQSEACRESQEEKEVTRRQLVLATVVFAGLAAVAAWRSPVPGVNEPHYLCKAKHFFDPSWCPRDFFLNSADAHRVFYALVGPLTRFLSLEQTAWAGRIAVWLGLALGWIRLASALHPGKFSPAWSAAIFLAIQSTVTFSGEWLVGGVEAKGFAYAALLLALPAACRHSWMEAGIALGSAISLHPVVGGWGAVALAAALLSGRFSPAGRSGDAGPETPAWSPTTWRSLLLAGAACLACSLPGLVPALALLAYGPTGRMGRLADEIQVFDRLKHHLDPLRFPAAAYVSYAALLVVWLLMRRWLERNAAERFFARFVLATLAIAAGGLMVGFTVRSAGMMKFYPFRLFDVFLPMAVSITAAATLERLVCRLAERHGRMARAMGHAIACAALAWGLIAPGRIANPSGYKHPETWPAFVEACEWIDRHAAHDALFLTPRSNAGFKWYARRAEFVTWKDCPQDAVGILEWKARLDWIARWRDRSLENGISELALAELARDTGIDYMLTWTAEESSCKPVFRNRSFSVYRALP